MLQPFKTSYGYFNKYVFLVNSEHWRLNLTFTLDSSAHVEIITQIIEALQRRLTLTMMPRLHLSFYFKTLTLAPGQ